MSILNDLSRIQKKLKAPKNQYNSFGKYKYRSCEDILEAVKPHLTNGLTLTLHDEIVAIGGRVYVMATAKLSKPEDAPISVSAYAREAETKKGMDDSQITGTASSYARKYALNGLFLIDDTKDADTDESKLQEKKEVKKQEPSIDDKIKKATEFCNNAIAQINELKSHDELQAWMGANVKLTGALMKYPELEKKFNDAYAEKLGAIQ